MNSLFTHQQKIVIVLVSVIVFLYIQDILIRISLSTDGQDLSLIEEQTKEIKKQNILLEQRILSEESYHKIEQKAKDQGFTDIQSYYYLQ